MVNILTRGIAVGLCLLLTAVPTHAVTVPSGTLIYGELMQEVTSKKKDFAEGDIVQVRVWRDVVVDGQVVVKAGSPMLAEISDLKKANFAGIKGRLKIRAKSVRGTDGTPHVGLGRPGHAPDLLSAVLVEDRNRLLGRLEDKPSGAGNTVILLQHPGSAQTDGGVGVVSAGVHDAGHHRSV